MKTADTSHPTDPAPQPPRSAETRRLKGAVVGMGRMGITHFALLNTHPEVHMRAACEPSRFTGNVLKTFGAVELFTDYRKMLDTMPLDFLIVATPTASHAPMIEAALDKGLHVFTEKPFVLDIDEGHRLAEKAHANHRVNQVGYFLRFNEVFNEVKRILDEGLIGPLLYFKNEMYGRTVLAPSRKGWRSSKHQGGGCLLDFASHAIDLADYLFGPPVDVTGSTLHQIYSKAVEDAVYTTFTYEQGFSGHLLANWSDASYRRPYNRIEIVGARGRIVADRQEYKLYLRNADKTGRFSQGWNIRYLPELARSVRFNIRGTEFTAQLDHFIDCIVGRSDRNACTFADALRTDRVMGRIQSDSRNGKAVRYG